METNDNIVALQVVQKLIEKMKEKMRVNNYRHMII
jgi:hypothetical protein